MHRTFTNHDGDILLGCGDFPLGKFNPQDDALLMFIDDMVVDLVKEIYYNVGPLKYENSDTYILQWCCLSKDRLHDF